MTLVEVSVSCAALLLLMALTVMILRTALTGWARVDVQQDLVQEMQVVGGTWVREVLAGSQAGLSVAPQACSLLSARDDTHQEEPSGLYGELLWRRYRLYFLDSGQLRRLNVDPTAPTASPSPLERVDLGAGRFPLDHYCTGGKTLLRGLTRVEFRRQGAVVHLLLEGSRAAYGRSQPQAVELHFSGEPRND